jgi:transposase-like protein
MARKRYKPEEIVAKLRQVDVLVSQGQNMVDAIRQIGVSEVTYYRWRQEFGGLKTEQVKSPVTRSMVPRILSWVIALGSEPEKATVTSFAPVILTGKSVTPGDAAD